jgi:hypothetical protein
VVRRAARHVAFALGIVATAFLPVRAQALARLTVESFTLASDTAAPRIDVPFHLFVTLRVRERVAEILDLDLPMLAKLELLGDERETKTGSHGTLYRETITLVAHDAGEVSIAPATLQAIDARDGKPKEWYTNALTLAVGGASTRAVQRGLSFVLAALRLLAWLLMGALALGLIGLAVVLIARRRRDKVPVAPPPVSVRVERSQREQAADALAVLRAERSRAAAISARAAIWQMVGAAGGETLGDVLRRRQSREPAMRDLLVALERSAFTYDDDLRRAVDDACAALQRYIASAT